MTSEKRACGLHRRVSPRVWSSADFRSLSTLGQMLWLYLLTSPRTTPIPGLLLGAGSGSIRDDLRKDWTTSDVERLMAEELEPRGMVRWSCDAQIVWLPGALRRPENYPANHNVVAGWANTWDLIPDCTLKAEIWAALDAYTRARSPSIHEMFTERCPRPSAPLEGEPAGTHPPGPPLGNPSCEPSGEPFMERSGEPFRGPFEVIGSGAREGEGAREGHAAEPAAQLTLASGPAVNVQAQAITEIWNKCAKGTPLRLVTTLNDERRKKIRARRKPDRDRAWWEAYFSRIANSEFCCGDSEKGWIATFDWAVKSEANVTKVLEGHYDGPNRKAAPTKSASDDFKRATFEPVPSAAVPRLKAVGSNDGGKA